MRETLLLRIVIASAGSEPAAIRRMTYLIGSGAESRPGVLAVCWECGSEPSLAARLGLWHHRFQIWVAQSTTVQKVSKSRTA
jgi:hypothetical protein